MLPLIINPAAGRGRATRHAGDISRLLDTDGIEHKRFESTARDDIEAMAFDLARAGQEKMIVCGGDGSIHEAVNGLMRAGSDASLGVIPLGTGNDFAKACGIPPDWQQATVDLAARLREGRDARRIDVGRMNDRYFANGVGIGFDAKINDIARGNRLPIGDLNYLVAVFQGLWDGVITPDIRLRYGDREYRGGVTLVEICNGATIGGMFRMAPDASNHDGLFDLVIVQPVSRARALSLLPRLLQGTHLAAPEVTTERVTALHLSAAAPVPSHLDGEMQAPGTEFLLDILPGALKIL